MPIELAWAALFPPLVAVLTVLLTVSLLGDGETRNTHADFLIPLMLGSMAVLCATIFFDCRATKAFRSRAAEVRTTQGISTGITLVFLAAVTTSQADHYRASDEAALILFLCLPVLFVCAGLLWHAATMIQSPFRRGLMLAGFVALTALVELQGFREVSRYADERLFMLNSLLVAAAFAVQLGIWSTRELGRRAKDAA
jgi:hypothetical protein